MIWARRLFSLATWLATAAAAVGLIGVMVFFMMPRLLGWELVVVQGGSMEPALPVGSVMFAAPVDPRDVRVGDIVSYRLPDMTPSQTRVTHRVVEVIAEEGDLAFRTKGDANEDPDIYVVAGSDVLGRVRWHMPWVGHLAHHLGTPLGFMMLVGLPGLFIITSEAFHIFSTLQRGRQGKHRPQQVNQRSHRPRGLAAWLTLGGIAALAVSPALLRTRAAEHRRQERAGTRARRQPRLWPPLCLVFLTLGLFGTGAGFWASGSYALFSDSETSYGNSLQAGVWGPIPATIDIDIDPDTLNPGSEGNYVMAYIELSGGFDVGNIDVSTVTLEVVGVDGSSVPAELSPTEVGDHDANGIADLMVKFDRAEVLGLIAGESGDITFRVKGDVSGSLFEGTDTIRVLDSQGAAEDSESAAPQEPPPPPSAPPVGYEVQPGDTLWAIAIRFGTTVEALVRLNQLQTPNLILYGSTLNVPYVGEDAGGATAGVSPQSRRASGRRSGQ